MQASRSNNKMMQQQRQMIPHPMSRMPPIPPEPIMTMPPQ